MERPSMKFLILGTGVVVTMIFLMIVGMNEPGGFSYYMTVSEFVQQPNPASSAFRVNGKVVAGSIERSAGGEGCRFSMTDGSANLQVSYEGIIPDTFVDDADVVVEGSLENDGVFSATTLLAKCPSKYESADDTTGELDAAAVY